MIFVSNQMAMSFLDKPKAELAFDHYDSSFWGSFPGRQEDNGDIYLYAKIDNDSYEYKSFVNKIEAKEAIKKIIDPMVVLQGKKNKISYICEKKNINSYVSNFNTILNEIPTKDSQKKKLYQWESESLVESKLSTKDLEALANTIIKEENLEDCILLERKKFKEKKKTLLGEFQKLAGRACGLEENAFIGHESIIQIDLCTDVTLVHEIAHAYVFKNYSVFGGEGHGAIFVYEYLRLLNKYISSCIKSNKLNGLKIASTSEAILAREKKTNLFY